MAETSFTPPVDHGREGSDTACAALLALALNVNGLSLIDLAAHIGRPPADVRQAIVGLSERRRVRSLGRGINARWYTVLHAANAEVQP